MKKRVTLSLITVFLVILAVPIASWGHGDKAKPPVVIKKPPESLDAYYPPKSNKMEFVEVMHGMSGGFKGTWIDAKQGQWDKALENAQTLEYNYKKMYDMSGKEWREKYINLKAAGDFKAAVAAQDMKKMGETAKVLGGTCGNCHYEQYTNVWLRYYWDDFEALELENPLTEEKEKFEDYKHKLVDAFYRLMNDGVQGERGALKAGSDFIELYEGLQATCMKCHEDEQVKYFYVGGKVKQALKSLENTLDKEPLSMKEVFRQIGVIGKEGCKKCHLTHRMAAILKKGHH